MMTGDNLIFRGDVQPEFWPDHWQYECQRDFGGLDACTSIPAGSMTRWAFNDTHAMPVSTVTSREAS